MLSLCLLDFWNRSTPGQGLVSEMFFFSLMASFLYEMLLFFFSFFLSYLNDVSCSVSAVLVRFEFSLFISFMRLSCFIFVCIYDYGINNLSLHQILTWNYWKGRNDPLCKRIKDSSDCCGVLTLETPSVNDERTTPARKHLKPLIVLCGEML